MQIKEDEEWILYMDMLFQNGIKWDFKSGQGKTLEEMKQLAKDNKLDIEQFKKDNPL